ncbi:hypothetical protein ACERNI_08965 [Camelimonas sp. ID_303_24]
MNSRATDALIISSLAGLGFILLGAPFLAGHIWHSRYMTTGQRTTSRNLTGALDARASAGGTSRRIGAISGPERGGTDDPAPASMYLTDHPLPALTPQRGAHGVEAEDLPPSFSSDRAAFAPSPSTARAPLHPVRRKYSEMGAPPPKPPRGLQRRTSAPTTFTGDDTAIASLPATASRQTSRLTTRNTAASGADWDELAWTRDFFL